MRLRTTKHFSKSRRWGRVSELDRRLRVGSPGYLEYPRRLKHLAAWRQMHLVAPGHMPVRMYGTRKRVRPSSDLPLALKESFAKSRT
jgi:hypothetical protein